jgi:DNA replication and repair protein RecF
MTLLKLDVYSVRNIKKVSIVPSPTINFFYGDNGSGKSALLEAIFLLGRAKSYRTALIKSVVATNEENLIVTGVVEYASGNTLSLGVQISDKKCLIQINRQPTQKRSELAYALPLQLVHSKSYELLDAGAQIRREFLDWGVFNEDENFLFIWRQFKKALAHRNLLLKKNAFNQLEVWSNELIAYGLQIANFRERYLNKLKPVFIGICRQLFAMDSIGLIFLSGWHNSVPLSQALVDDFNKDIRYGFTHSGPHRGDFHVLIQGELAKNYVSRGQLKLLVISLLLAQVRLLVNEGGNPPCILIDDFAAELDVENRRKILAYLTTMNCQVFITAIEKDDFGALDGVINYKLFHVEHGNITQM